MNGLNLSLSNQSKHKKKGDEAESDKEKQLEAFWNQAWHPVFKTGGASAVQPFFFFLHSQRLLLQPQHRVWKPKKKLKRTNNESIVRHKRGQPLPFIGCVLKTYYNWINHILIYKRTCRKARQTHCMAILVSQNMNSLPLSTVCIWPFVHSGLITSAPLLFRQSEGNELLYMPVQPPGALSVSQRTRST